MGGSDADLVSQVSLASTTTTTSPPCEGTTTTELPKHSASGGSRAAEESQKDTTTTDVKSGGPGEVTEATKIAKSSAIVDKPFAEEVYFSSKHHEPWMSAKDLKALRRGVEWFFSDSNLSTDQTLHHKISQRLPEGWLCCSELVRLEPLRQLGATPEFLIKCLRHSFLEIKNTLTADELRTAAGTPGEFGNSSSSRGVFVRRRQPLPPLLSRDQLHLHCQAICDPAKFVLVDRHQTMNRLRDLWRVERQLKLREIGDDVTVFRERILPSVSYESRPPNDTPVVFAVGYERVVYGDHGPYIEFSSSQIRWKAWPHFFDKRKFNSYYNEYYTKASHSIWEAKWSQWDPNPTNGVLMLYAQSLPVSDRPWAPGAGSTAPHAGRPTGYADYRPGFFYLTADESFVIAESQV